MPARAIEIMCPPEWLDGNEARRARLQACQRLAAVDRPPVVFSLTSRFLFHARGQPIGDYYRNPRTQLEQQLLNHKWLLEHPVDERVVETDAITVAPDLSTLRGGYYDVGVRWYSDGSACAEPILCEPEDIDALAVPEVEAGHYGRMLSWYREMKDLAAEYEVTLNGRPLEIRVTIGVPGGPIPDAYALAGERLFVWMLEHPQRVHRLMDTLTKAFINLQRHVRALRGDGIAGLYMGCDAGEMLSPALFEEFVVPYYSRCYEAFAGVRGLHMCGRIDHLLPLIANRLAVTHLVGFGFSTDPTLLVRYLGGRAVMSGGLNPVLLLEGPTDAIKRETRRYMDVFAPCGGYILQDGNNVAPGTPLSHLRAVLEAASQSAAK